MLPISNLLSALESPRVETVGVGVAELAVATTGSYYSRVSAYNGVSLSGATGSCAHESEDCWGETRESKPSVLSIHSDQPPALVTMPQARVVSQSEVFVEWDMPQHTGGKDVTHFKVEWDIVPTFDGPDYNTWTVFASNPAPILDVQSISTSMTPSSSKFIGDRKSVV